MNINFSSNRRGALATAVKSVAGASLLTALVSKAPAAFAAAPAGANPGTSPDTTVSVFILPGGLLGPDGKMHDSFVPSNFVVGANVPTTLHFVNFDDGSHSVTSDDLGLNIVVAAATKDSSGAIVPAVTDATINVDKGSYRWDCELTCDGGAAAHWAMSPDFAGDGQEGYMAGLIVAV